MYVLSALKWLKIDLEFNCKVELSEKKKYSDSAQMKEGNLKEMTWNGEKYIVLILKCIVHVRLYVMHIKEFDSFHEIE